MFRYVSVLLCFCVCWTLVTAFSRRRYGYRNQQSYGTCGAPRGVTHVRFPDIRNLLTLEELEEYVVDNVLTEMYVAVNRPRPFSPDLAYKTMITKIADSAGTSYMQTSGGITDSAILECSRREYVLTPFRNRAYFDRDATFNGKNSTLALWSSCPSSYIIFIFCEERDLEQGRCPIESTIIVFQVQGDSLDDLLWDDMLNDLCSGTGIRFGQKDFEWLFNYDTDDVCDITDM